jgi:hypothetical protein
MKYLVVIGVLLVVIAGILVVRMPITDGWKLAKINPKSEIYFVGIWLPEKEWFSLVKKDGKVVSLYVGSQKEKISIFETKIWLGLRWRREVKGKDWGELFKVDDRVVFVAGERGLEEIVEIIDLGRENVR